MSRFPKPHTLRYSIIQVLPASPHHSPMPPLLSYHLSYPSSTTLLHPRSQAPPNRDAATIKMIHSTLKNLITQESSYILTTDGDWP